jgi:hypothetical protein
LARSRWTLMRADLARERRGGRACRHSVHRPAHRGAAARALRARAAAPQHRRGVVTA